MSDVVERVRRARPLAECGSFCGEGGGGCVGIFPSRIGQAYLIVQNLCSLLGLKLL